MIIKIINFLNLNIGPIQSISMIVLVVITAFYAWQTRCLNNLITRQIYPNISLNSFKLHSSLKDQKRIQDIQIKIKQKSQNTYSLRFELQYSVINNSASPGTIEKPSLIIFHPKLKKELKLEVGGKRGIPSSFKTESASEMLATIKLWEMNDEINNTIYLRIREKKNIEQIYFYHVMCENPSKDALFLLNNAENLKYKVLYNNSTGKIITENLKKDDVQILFD